MANKPCSALFFLLQNLVPLLVLSANTFSRSEFPLPPDFVFGSGTSAYQSEGKKFTEGRTPSIWETFAHSGNVHGATGDVACDGYHKYKVINTRKMSNSGWKPAYRFSISWSRLIPDGRGHVNPKGVEYYNHHINELIKHDEYGWLSRQFVKDFTAYADVCFREFGGTVLHWTTLNEANVFSIYRHHHILLAHASAAKLHRKTYQVFAVGCGFFAAAYNLS